MGESGSLHLRICEDRAGLVRERVAMHPPGPAPAAFEPEVRRSPSAPKPTWTRAQACRAGAGVLLLVFTVGLVSFLAGQSLAGQRVRFHDGKVQFARTATQAPTPDRIPV